MLDRNTRYRREGQVEEKETIRRLYFNRRHSVREIAKELNHSRKTIEKTISDASDPDYRLTKTDPARSWTHLGILLGSGLKKIVDTLPNSPIPLTAYLPGWKWSVLQVADSCLPNPTCLVARYITMPCRLSHLAMQTSQNVSRHFHFGYPPSQNIH